MKGAVEPKTYEWQVLPFGSTYSPCCTIYALQQHVQDVCGSNQDLVDCVEQSFSVDNCIHSTHSKEEFKGLVDGLCQMLHTGGFKICQWASNIPAVIVYLLFNVRSESSDLWFSQSRTSLKSQFLDCHGKSTFNLSWLDLEWLPRSNWPWHV